MVSLVTGVPVVSLVTGVTVVSLVTGVTVVSQVTALTWMSAGSFSVYGVPDDCSTQGIYWFFQ